MLWSNLLMSGVSGLEFVGGKAETISATRTPSFSLTNLTGGLASAPAAGDTVIACVAFINSTDRNLLQGFNGCRYNSCVRLGG